MTKLNERGFACFDLSMKNDKRQGVWLQHHFGATASKPNPKWEKDYDPKQYAPSGWHGKD